jgi:hypothetical protein
MLSVLSMTDSIDLYYSYRSINPSPIMPSYGYIYRGPSDLDLSAQSCNYNVDVRAITNFYVTAT